MAGFVFFGFFLWILIFLLFFPRFNLAVKSEFLLCDLVTHLMGTDWDQQRIRALLQGGMGTRSGKAR